MTTKPTIPQLKYFVSCVDTQVGQAIVEQVRNDHWNDVNPHIILGTKSPKLVGPVPKSVKQLVNNNDPNVLAKTLLDSDIIIYDLSTAKLDEVEYAIKVLKLANYQSEKFLILISSVMVWSHTAPKERKAGEVVEEEHIHNEAEQHEATQREAEEDEPKKTSISYNESEYARRRPSTFYEIHKALEMQCMNAGNTKKNLLSYVLCSGVVYGNGEDVFANYFKHAFLQEPEALSYIGEGNNLIPTIHVRDLAMFVNFVISRRPSSRYIFAIDHAKNPSLKNHVAAISNGLGTGKIQSATVMDFMKDPYLDVLRLDIDLQPSNLIEIMENDDDEEKSEITEGDFDPLASQKFKFIWWCKEGLRKNIAKVVEEYKTYRGLKPVKIFISGPPAVGKTHFGTILSRNYNVPHILVADIVKEIQGLQNDFGEEIRTILAEIKAKMIADAEAALEEWKKKKKKGVPEPVVDPEKLIPRLPDDALCRVFKYRLEQNDCLTRGYILDGFPKTYEHAKVIFLTKAPPKEGESPSNAFALDTRIAPQFLFKMEAPDEFLKARVKGLPEDKVTGTHHTEEGMNRRLPLYHKHNAPEANPSLMGFFEEKGLEVFRLKCDDLSEEEIVQAKKDYIEKKETFKKFLDQNELDEMRQKRRIREEQEEENKKQETARKEQESREYEEKLLIEEKARIKMEILKESEKRLLDERSQPLRQYLADMVVPLLTSGIIEICKEKPEDPVDFLADFLYRKSIEPKVTEASGNPPGQNLINPEEA